MCYSIPALLNFPQLTFGIEIDKTYPMTARICNMEGHTEVLQEAFSSLAGRSGGLQVQTKEGTLVTLNKDLLLLFSPVLRSLPSSSLVVDSMLMLPDISLTAVLALTALLTRGTSRFDYILVTLLCYT